MSEEQVNQVNAKVRRRGVSNETKGTSQLLFNETDAAQNGLFIGQLAEVSIEYTTGKDDTNFAGLKLPRLVFHFTSEHTKVEEKRHYYHTIFPVESSVETIPGGAKEWRVNNVFAWIKHILDVFYLNGRELNEAEENALILPFEDFDEEGQFVMVEPQTVLDGYATLFTQVVAMMNGTSTINGEATNKPCYKDNNGKYIRIWMKLLRHNKDKQGNWKNVGQNGELAFDNFIGAGCIERHGGQGTLPKRLRIDVVKESITAKPVKKTPDLGGANVMPGMMGGVMTQMMPGAAPMDTQAYMEAGADAPF